MALRSMDMQDRENEKAPHGAGQMGRIQREIDRIKAAQITLVFMPPSKLSFGRWSLRASSYRLR